MSAEELQHYVEIAETLAHERIDNKYVLTIDDDNAGCCAMVEHFFYEKSPFLLELRWTR